MGEVSPAGVEEEGLCCPLALQPSITATFAAVDK